MQVDRIKRHVDYTEELSYREPMLVSYLQAIPFRGGYTTYPICPRCESSMEREYVSYCDRCGQALDWSEIHIASIRLPHQK